MLSNFVPFLIENFSQSTFGHFFKQRKISVLNSIWHFASSQIQLIRDAKNQFIQNRENQFNETGRPVSFLNLKLNFEFNLIFDSRDVNPKMLDEKWQTLKIRKYTESGYETLALGPLFWFRPGNDLITFQTTNCLMKDFNDTR